MHWEVLPYEPYSSNLALMDYYIFMLLGNHILNKTHLNQNVLENGLISFFNKTPEFCKNGMKTLV